MPVLLRKVVCELKRELADKPGFVEDNHSSGMHVTAHL